MPFAFQLIHIENNSEAPVKTVILPDNAVVLAIQSGNSAYEIVNGKRIILPKIHICGHLTQKKEYEREPGSRTTLVKFQPWTAGLYLSGIREAVDKNIDCADISMGIDLSDTENETGILSLLKGIFKQVSVDQSILQSVSIIEKMHGQIRVDDLADQVCNSKRNFERKFSDAIGLTPKEFITNCRFSHALKLMASRNNLTEVSYECGYYDQSHFINDFKEITGVSPENYSQVIKPVQNWALATRAYR